MEPERLGRLANAGHVPRKRPDEDFFLHMLQYFSSFLYLETFLLNGLHLKVSEEKRRELIICRRFYLALMISVFCIWSHVHNADVHIVEKAMTFSAPLFFFLQSATLLFKLALTLTMPQISGLNVRQIFLC